MGVVCGVAISASPGNVMHDEKQLARGGPSRVLKKGCWICAL